MLQMLTRPAAFGGLDLSVIIPKVTQGAVDYYDTLNKINLAKYNAQLVKAQAKSAVLAAKAGGQNAAEVARTGLPSPTLLVVGGLALATLVILKK